VKCKAAVTPNITKLLSYKCEIFVYRLMVFEDRVLSKGFGSDEEQVTGDGQNCIMANFVM
jgi:hypothetical protein